MHVQRGVLGRLKLADGEGGRARPAEPGAERSHSGDWGPAGLGKRQEAGAHGHGQELPPGRDVGR